jgi:hypothetical protein
VDTKLSDLCLSRACDFSAPGASALKREAEEELVPGGRAVEPEAGKELALGASAVEREAEEDLALKNSAPTSVPRRHFTRAGRPLLFFDRIKVNVLGRL